ncbi:MAG: phosphoglycolate phosphatase, partial [Deltaproteobacteria bacterium]
MSIDTFLFDLDGTLVDSIPDLTKAINLLREELDLPAVTSD